MLVRRLKKTTQCKKHDWSIITGNPKQVVCSVCGTTQYVVRMKPAQREKILQKAQAKKPSSKDKPEEEKKVAIRAKALTKINKVARELGMERPASLPKAKAPPVLTAKTVEEEPELKLEPVDLLIWVGKEHYTVDSFVTEARKMGVSRRVPFAPLGATPGKTRVFLAHEETSIGPALFGWFTLQNVVFVVTPGTELEREFKERGITTYELREGGFGTQDERGCGSLSGGGIYLLSEEDMNKVRDLAKSSKLEGHINIFEHPIPIKTANRSRGYQYVSGDRILDGKPEDTWFEDAHKVFHENEKKAWRWRDAIRKAPPEETA